MEKDWVKIYSTGEEYKAGLIKNMLEGEGINVILINKKDSAYLFGEVEVYVKRDHVLRALNLINKNNE